MNPPTALKPLVRILKTAEQIEKHDPVVAWCCRHYAVELGMELRAGSNDPAIMKYLSDLLDQIESGKAEVDAITNTKEQYLRDFADRVFTVAETEYQGGRASKNTARSFLHAAVFFESLKHFSPLNEEILGRIRYSKWKATEIMNAIAEGRTPGPEGSSERQLDEEMNGAGVVDVPSSPAFGNMSYAASPINSAQIPPASSPKPLSDSSDLDLPDVPVFSQSQLNTQARFNPSTGAGARASPTNAQQNFNAAAPTQQFNPQNPSGQGAPNAYPSAPAQQHQPPQQSLSAATQPVTGGARPPNDVQAPTTKPNTTAFTSFISSKVVIQPKAVPANIDTILEATKFSKNAISALQFDDPETAIKNLRAALRVLTGYEQ